MKMKDNSMVEAIQTESLGVVIFDKHTHKKIAKYYFSPFAGLANNAQLTSDITEAYEKYCRSIQKRLSSQ